MVVAWKLNLDNVAVGVMGSSSGPFTTGPTRHGGTPARREMTLSLTHVPTGIRVEKVAIGPFTRKQAAATKAQLRAELLPILEAQVAAHLRVPGR